MSKRWVQLKQLPLKIVRSRKSIDVEENSCVNFRFGLKELSRPRKVSSSSMVLFQMMKISSIYLSSRKGVVDCLEKLLDNLRHIDISHCRRECGPHCCAFYLLKIKTRKGEVVVVYIYM